MFINIHSHVAFNSGEFVIKNLSNNFEEITSGRYFSAGLHPWYLHENTWQSDFNIVAEHAVNKAVLAIGECGLDKSCDTNFALQEKVFSAQIVLAN